VKFTLEPPYLPLQKPKPVCVVTKKSCAPPEGPSSICVEQVSPTTMHHIVYHRRLLLQVAPSSLL